MTSKRDASAADRPAALKPLVQPLAEELGAARGEEDRDPAVGDLRRQRDVLRSHRGQVDGQVGATVQDRAERLAESGGPRAGVRDLVVLAAELHGLLAAQDRAHDLDVLAGLDERLAEGLTVPALGDLRPGDAEAQAEAAPRQRVEGHRGHRRHGRRPRRDLHDPGADVDALGPRRDPRRGDDGVGAIGLGRPHGVVAEPLGFQDPGHVEGHGRARIVEVQRQPHARSLPSRPFVAARRGRPGGSQR